MALMLLSLGTIIKSPQIGHADEKGPEKHTTRKQQAQINSRYLPSERSLLVGFDCWLLVAQKFEYAPLNCAQTVLQLE